MLLSKRYSGSDPIAVVLHHSAIAAVCADRSSRHQTAQELLCMLALGEAEHLVPNPVALE